MLDTKLRTPVAAAPRNFFATTEIFKSLSANQTAELEKRALVKKFRKGETLFLEGDPAQFVWFVKEGHVKATVHSPNGRNMTLCMVGAKGMVGSCCCFGAAQAEHPCQGVAETDTTLYALPMAEFQALLTRYPEVAFATVEAVSRRLRDSKDMQTFEQESVEKRILHLLVKLVREFGKTIPLTRRQVAEMAGTTVETCIRTFSSLEEEGIVKTERGRITVPDLLAVQERLEEL